MTSRPTTSAFLRRARSSRSTIDIELVGWTTRSRFLMLHESYTCTHIRLTTGFSSFLLGCFPAPTPRKFSVNAYFLRGPSTYAPSQSIHPVDRFFCRAECQPGFRPTDPG